MKEGWLGWLKNSILNLFNTPQQPDFKLVLERSALNKSTAKYVINDPGNYDPVTFLNMVKERILNKRRENPRSKICMNLPCTMVKLEMMHTLALNRRQYTREQILKKYIRL